MPLFVRQHNALVANDAGLCVVHYALLIHGAWAICAMRCWGSCSEAIRIAEEHLDRALGRYFWLANSEMYPQKYPSIPPEECTTENGDF